MPSSALRTPGAEGTCAEVFTGSGENDPKTSKSNLPHVQSPHSAAYAQHGQGNKLSKTQDISSILLCTYAT